MARLWTRKREDQGAPGAPRSKRAESVHLDDADHAWWAQAEVNQAWKPPKRTDPEQERDVLAELFGEDWRTSFQYSGPSPKQLEEERRREPQALDDQDP